MTEIANSILTKVTTEFKAENKTKKNLSMEGDYTFIPTINHRTSQDLERRRQRTIKMIQLAMQTKQKDFPV